jgi:hypothetical protein
MQVMQVTQTQQNSKNENKVVWPFPTVNGECTQASQELLDSKQYTTKDVFSTDDYEEAML